MRRGSADRYPELAAELVHLKVDIVVVEGGNTPSPGGQECDQDDSHRYDRSLTVPSKQAWLKALPVRAAMSPALAALARELGGKRLELLKEAVPKVLRVTVFYSSSESDQCTRRERGSPSRGTRAEIDSSALAGSKMRTISRRYSPRRISNARWTLPASGSR